MRCRRPTCLLALLAASCVRFTYSVEHLEDPIDPQDLASLAPERDDLGSCLGRLGAPHYVFPWRGDGVALAWLSSDASTFGVNVSVALVREASASFEGSWASTDLPGVVLWFDGELHLVEWRQGSMRELTRELRRRPVADEPPR